MCPGHPRRWKTFDTFHRPSFTLSRLHRPEDEVYSSDPQLVRAYPVRQHRTGYIDSDRSCFDKYKRDVVQATSEPASPNFYLKEKCCNEFYNNICYGDDNLESGEGYNNNNKNNKNTNNNFDGDDSLQFPVEKKSDEVSNTKIKVSDVTFLEPLDDRHKCPICLDALHQPCQTNCGHRFCNGCITAWINNTDRNHPKCPNCKMKIHPSNIYPDNFAKREIDSLLICCPNQYRGCSNVFAFKDLNDHLKKECPMKSSNQSGVKGQQIKIKEFTDWLDFIVEEILHSSPAHRRPPTSNQHLSLPDKPTSSPSPSSGRNNPSHGLSPQTRPGALYKSNNVLKRLKNFSSEEDYYGDVDDLALTDDCLDSIDCLAKHPSPCSMSFSSSLSLSSSSPSSSLSSSSPSSSLSS